LTSSIPHPVQEKAPFEFSSFFLKRQSPFETRSEKILHRMSASGSATGDWLPGSVLVKFFSSKWCSFMVIPFLVSLRVIGIPALNGKLHGIPDVERLLRIQRMIDRLVIDPG
jgi:hypothetical protein